MKFLLDVHIAFKIKNFLINDLLVETIHVNHILESYYSSDRQIASYADEHGLTVITKDIDFRNTHFINQTPRRIIRICLGNISNQDLISLLKKHWQVIEKMHQKYDRFYCEINKEDISLIV